MEFEKETSRFFGGRNDSEGVKSDEEGRKVSPDGGECVPVGSESFSDLSDDEKIERAAERILEKYLSAFEELAK